ncbi:spondin-1 [Scaptodrosophila lebanonensis]|uniref:Spondin-1 n=1 Tax=Drosophila lebanonensis TaxID=7225 RepID=A0A6J2U9A7_DROLE|nr:spondin-1 [Scaptodrosophila lebanonensis]XP_030383751.1 spondin-1 [Scaptodrosophila lebanonensis]XP_030383752.1 spondin-1 [Scaptodrosophila lebanonensis]
MKTKGKMHWLMLCLTILFASAPMPSQACSRIPSGVTAAKSPVDDNYVLSIAGNAQTYVPGQKYNVTLSAYSGLSFVSFMLALERENTDSVDENPMGTFEISDLAETRFSPRCANLVENTNTNVKTRVDVVWVAPAKAGLGCVLLRATVVQHRDVWFMDDGFLTKRICEEEIDDVDTQPSIIDPCCACDEAKYELTFEGKWSRHTHPKDFPANSWRTRFSDIIGASHTIGYRFWQYGDLASEGLREVAEHGSTRTLESELKDQSDQIRTIIKARGIAYPNVTGKTFAVFRVDSKHHLISLVSMLDPSPDWIVGVSGLELCLPNCSWVENKVHNLYPWDAGTDSGPSYMSADQPQVPPDVVRRIKSNFPNDPRSPFYDPSGAQMKPLATLHINRRRLYEKNCEASDSEQMPVECATQAWSRWDECSAKCGPGKQYRTREFRNPALAHRHRCSNALREEKHCMGRKCVTFNEEAVEGGVQQEAGYPGSGPEDPECGLSEWSDWSSCTVTCGTGEMIRTRHYLNRRAKKKCQKVSKARLQEARPCEGIDCGGDINGNGHFNNEAGEDMEAEAGDGADNSGEKRSIFRNFESYSQRREDYIPPECGVSPWSDFSPCLGPCGGTGQRQRMRKVWNKNEVYGIQNPSLSPDAGDPCRHIKLLEVVNCTNPSCDSIVPHFCYEPLRESYCRDSDVANYWYYDYASDQCAIYWSDRCDVNQNKFKSKELCEETCRVPRHKHELQSESLRTNSEIRVDCLVSDWVAHSCNATCGREGLQLKTRRVLRTPKYGGKQCPKHLVRQDRCYQRCDDMYSISGPYASDRRHMPSKTPISIKDECRYSEWSAWTPCTASCGDNAVRQRTRTLLNSDLSYKCKDRVRIEKCVMMPCLLSHNDDTDKW